MNKVVISGRWTKDPEIHDYSGTKVAKGTLAVNRKYSKDEEQKADFILVKAFNKTAEFIEKYHRKGMKADISGRIETGSYEKDGRKVYTTEVIIEEIEFGESKRTGEIVQEGKIDKDGFMVAPEGIEEVFNF